VFRFFMEALGVKGLIGSVKDQLCEYDQHSAYPC